MCILSPLNCYFMAWSVKGRPIIKVTTSKAAPYLEKTLLLIFYSQRGTNGITRYEISVSMLKFVLNVF